MRIPLTTSGGVKIDPMDPAFSLTTNPDQDTDKPAIYLFSSAIDGDGMAYAMAEDGTVLGSHFCSHWGYLRHDLHDRPDRTQTCEAHYPHGYRLVLLTEPGSLPPPIVLERNREQGAASRDTGHDDG